MKINNDIEQLIKEIKAYNRGYYISLLFVNKKDFCSLLLLLYLYMELNKTIFSNSEKNIICSKFVWWRNFLISTNNKDVPNVQFFRVYYKIYNVDKKALNIYLSLVDSAEKFYSSGKFTLKNSSYIKYILRRNTIIKNLLNISFIDRKFSKSLNFAVISEYFSFMNENERSQNLLQRAKKLNRRPDRKYLFFYLLHRDYDGLNKIKIILRALFRYW